MPEPSNAQDRRLRILHVLRAPLGGLFRHVLDLTREQIARGHSVGLIADASTGGAMADQVLAELEPQLALGLRRFPMRRNPHLSDLAAQLNVVATTRAMKPDVVHGHGSKGAVYARLPAMFPGSHRGPVRVYTPHGGSLHYAPGTALHAVYMQVERLLARNSDLILFESAYIAERYRASVGEPPRLSRIALNGLADAEFNPVAPREYAADFLYVGELRAAKGIDILLDALAATCAVTGRRLTAVLIGSGPDREALEARSRRLGLDGQISFPGPLPARRAFTLGRVLLVPSRIDSLPYVVLEAAAAQVPLIATSVGGVPEIFGPYGDRLVPPNRADLLQAKMVEWLALPIERQRSDSALLADHVRSRFCMKQMVDGVLAGYRDALAAKAKAHGAAALPALDARPSGL